MNVGYKCSCQPSHQKIENVRCSRVSTRYKDEQGSEGTHPCIADVCITSKWMVSFTSRPFHPWGKRWRRPPHRRLCEIFWRPGQWQRAKKLYSCRQQNRVGPTCSLISIVTKLRPIEFKIKPFHVTRKNPWPLWADVVSIRMQELVSKIWVRRMSAWIRFNYSIQI